MAIHTDFREGCSTLPLILLQQHLDEREKAEFLQVFGDGVAETDIDRLCGLMAERGAFDEAQAAAQEQADLAIAALAALPEGDSRQLLEAVAAFVVARQA